MITHLDKINSILKDDRLLPEQIESMKKFKNHYLYNIDKEPRTVWNRLWLVQRLGLVIQKPFEEMDEFDLRDFYYEEHEINSRLMHIASKSVGTRNEYKRSLKVFFQFLKHTEPIEWFEYKSEKSIKTEEEMLTMEEIEALIENAGSVRNKAIIALFYDSAVRCGEMYNLNYGDVVNIKEKFGVTINVTGKTGKRSIPLHVSLRYLTEYMNNHETKKADDPLWLTSEGEIKRVSQKQFDNLIKNAAIKAGLMEKRVKGVKPNHKKVVYPHLFRHTRLTHFAAMVGINESVLRRFAGWTAASTMPEVYIHLSNKQINNAIWTAQGVEIKEDDKVDYNLKGWTCARGHENGMSSTICWGCGQMKDRPIVIEEKTDAENEDYIKGIVQKMLEGNIPATKYMNRRSEKISKQKAIDKLEDEERKHKGSLVEFPNVTLEPLDVLEKKAIIKEMKESVE